MMWKRRIDKWLQARDARTLKIGFRTYGWIDSMIKDIHRWHLPVTIKCTHPSDMIPRYSTKYYCWFERLGDPYGYVQQLSDTLDKQALEKLKQGIFPAIKE